MRVAQINATCGTGSTGKICTGIGSLLHEYDIENVIFFCQGDNNQQFGSKYASEYYIKMQALRSRVFGNFGFNSVSATRKLLASLHEFEPDIVHLHNIHGHNCNLEMLFDYLKRNNLKVVWTFHDCWAFTAYCPHFEFACCSQWVGGCHVCPQRSFYSWFFNKSDYLYRKKKEILSGLNLTIVTPSRWLQRHVDQSFLNDYPCYVINNGIDLSVFRPRKSDFRLKYGVSNEKSVILGVAFNWGVKKGLNAILYLARILDPKKYQIVLVGTNKAVEKRLPAGIISIQRTNNQQELAEIYSAADLFINPTLEENYPTVNMEALACGTPVLTYDTGGSAEIITDSCGVSVPCGDVDALTREVKRIIESQPFSLDACLKQARNFDREARFKDYIRLYQKLMS